MIIHKYHHRLLLVGEGQEASLTVGALEEEASSPEDQEEGASCLGAREEGASCLGVRVGEAIPFQVELVEGGVHPLGLEEVPYSKECLQVRAGEASSYFPEEEEVGAVDRLVPSFLEGEVEEEVVCPYLAEEVVEEAYHIVKLAPGISHTERAFPKAMLAPKHFS